MIEVEAVLDVLLCDFLRIHPDLYDIVRCTLLAATFRTKIVTLDAFLGNEGFDRHVVKRLESLSELRNVLAHAQATWPVAQSFDASEELVFIQYRDGRAKRHHSTENELEDRLKEVSGVWSEIRSLQETLVQHRKGTTYLHVVSPSGSQQHWDTRDAHPEDVPEDFRNLFISPVDGGPSADSSPAE